MPRLFPIPFRHSARERLPQPDEHTQAVAETALEARRDDEVDALAEAELRRADALFLLGRLIFGSYFLYNGINHFTQTDMLTAYARSKNVAQPELAVLGSGALLVAGGLSVITGVQPRFGAAAITAFLLGVSPKMHDYWNVSDPQQRMAEMVNFTKNMALVGGAFLAAGQPRPWGYSLEG
jgi:putative oxidoreductase